MALDIIARAAAASASAAAAPPFLFTAIGGKFIDSAITAVISSGYAAPGKGAGCYVSDSVATAALTAAHPRFCKQSANGRYFRLVPASGTNAISVEQGGAVGAPGTDDRAAIQAAIDYAIANRIHEVQFLHTSYACKAGTRVAGGFGDINPTGSMISINGALAPAPASIRLFSPSGNTTITRIGYNTGGDPNTDHQTFAGNPYRGGGIQLYGTQYNDTAAYADQNLWAIQRFEMDGITIEGNTGAGWNGVGPTSGAEQNDKGI
jgi:hypothetical protein